MKTRPINPSREKIRDLLKTNYFKVPIFQRGYSWNIQNWEEFWSDLNKHTREGFDFFLGSLVVKSSSNDEVSEVIDGQQRISTIVIFLSVVRDILQEREDPESKDIQKDFIYYKETFKSEKPKIKLNKDENTFFQTHVIKDNSPMINVKNRGLKEGERNILKAYRFFHDQLKNASTELIRNITTNLLDNSYVILIEVQDDIQAYVVFETLNSRGEDLSASDLIKNAIFTQANKDEILEDITPLWEKMISNLDNLKTTWFIKNYITSISKEGIIREKDLFRFIKKERLIEQNVEKFASNLLEESVNYKQLFEPTLSKWNDKNIVTSLKGINKLNLRTCYPFLLAISSSQLNTKQQRKLINLTENLGFRYSIILKRNPNKLETKYAEWAYQLRNNVSVETIEKEIKEFMPLDEDFYNEFLRKSEKNNQIAKYILMKIWNHALGDVISIDENSSLEHILPENNDKWKKYIEENNDMILDGKKVSIDEFSKQVTYLLGNFTLLHPDDNSKLGNDTFDNKKNKVFSKSQFELNKNIAKEHKWSLKEIEKYQQELAIKAKEVW